MSWTAAPPTPIEAVYSYHTDTVTITFDQILQPGLQDPGSIRFLIDDVIKEPTVIETLDNRLVASEPITVASQFEPNSVTYAPPPYVIRSLAGVLAGPFDRFPLNVE